MSNKKLNNQKANQVLKELDEIIGDGEVAELRRIRILLGAFGTKVASGMLQAVKSALPKMFQDQIKADLSVKVEVPKEVEARITNWEDMPTVQPVVNVSVPDKVTLSDTKPAWYVAPTPVDLQPMQIGLTSIATALVQLGVGLTKPMLLDKRYEYLGKASEVPLGVVLHDTNGKPYDFRQMLQDVFLPVGSSIGGGGGSSTGIVQQGARDVTAQNWYVMLRDSSDNEIDPRDRAWTLSSGTDSVAAVQSGLWSVSITGTPDVNVTDRAARLVGIVYGENAQLQQRTTTNELETYDTNLATVLGTSSLINSGRLKVEASPTSGSVWDVSDRAARLLGVVYGSQGQQLSQKATTFELNTYDTNLATVLGTASLINSGRLKVEASPLSGSVWDVSDRAGRLLGVIYGSQGQQLSQRATTFEANVWDTNLATVLGTASLIASGRLKVEASQLTSPWVTSISGTVTVDTELPAAGALGDSVSNPTTPMVGAAGMLWNVTNWERWQAARNGLNSTGVGVGNMAAVGQFDDTSTGSVTENQFAHVRISSRRAWYVEGVTAHDIPVTENPLLVGERASFAKPTQVSADGDKVNAWSERSGARVVSNPTGTRTVGTTDCPSASTAYRITTSSTWVHNFVLQAKRGNVGVITWGHSSTYANNTMELRPGQSIPLGTIDISLLYFGSDAAGDDINYNYTS